MSEQEALIYLAFAIETVWYRLMAKGHLLWQMKGIAVSRLPLVVGHERLAICGCARHSSEVAKEALRNLYE